MRQYDDFMMIDEAFNHVDDLKCLKGLDELTRPQQVLWLIWGALGLIGNGSFQYFFECGCDPDAVAEAFRDLGMPEVSDVFQAAAANIPGHLLNDEEARFRFVQEHEPMYDDLARRVLAAEDETVWRLTKYIRCQW